MSKSNFKFQEWMDSKGFGDVRFYPKNAKESSTVELLDCAYSAVIAYESGQGLEYTDETETYV